MGKTTETKTRQVGREYTDWAQQGINAGLGFGRGGLESTLSQLGQQKYNELTLAQQAQRPEAYWDLFMSQAPQLQGLIAGAQSPLEQALTERAQRLSSEATKAVASNLSGLGALYSGATIEGASKAASEAFSDVASQLGQQQIGIFGSLLAPTLQAGLTAQENQYNRALQAAEGDRAAQLNALLNQAQLYGNIYGGALQSMAQWGMPTYYQETQKTPWGQFLDIAVPVATTAAGVATGNWLARPPARV
jgi:hypothetical protein